jgi:outer membrane protein OmpA-like peptidoglycan-associated protein
MRRAPLLMSIVGLILAVAFIGCGGYVKKDELEKQLSGQKMDLEQRVQLAQDAAATANDKADKALSATSNINKMKDEILMNVDGKIDAAMVAAKGDTEKMNAEMKRLAEEAAGNAVAEVKAVMMEEDEKVKQMAKEAADKAMNAAMEADRRAEEAARQAEIAKTLPKIAEPDVFAVYFDPGKVNIKSEGVTELEKAAMMIKENPDAVIKIQGHADNTPVVYSKYRNNWLLSQARAEAVKAYLVDNLGVSADRVKESVGFGEYKPTASNDKNNKWQNRRVEVLITK